MSDGSSCGAESEDEDPGGAFAARLAAPLFAPDPPRREPLEELNREEAVVVPR